MCNNFYIFIIIIGGGGGRGLLFVLLQFETLKKSFETTITLAYSILKIDNRWSFRKDGSAFSTMLGQRVGRILQDRQNFVLKMCFCTIICIALRNKTLGYRLQGIPKRPSCLVPRRTHILEAYRVAWGPLCMASSSCLARLASPAAAMPCRAPLKHTRDGFTPEIRVIFCKTQTYDGWMRSQRIY